MKRLQDYTFEEVSTALDGAISIKEVMQNLGIPVNNGNYRRIRRIVEQHDLTLPKFVYDKAHMDSLRKTLTDDEFFVKDSVRSGPAIKKRLFRLGFSDICSEDGCGQGPTWNGKPLVLHVDHIDGDNFNNILSNLRILCGHCHSQTDTFGNRRGKTYNYCECGNRVPKKNKYCSGCRPENKGSSVRLDYPEVDAIVQKIQELGGWSATERFFGIGQNSLRKHLKRNGIEPSSIKYTRRVVSE